MNTTRATLLGLTLLFSAQFAAGQGPTERQKELIAAIVEGVDLTNDLGKWNEAAATAGGSNRFDRLVSYSLLEVTLEKEVFDTLWAALQMRNDQQTGSTPQNSGTTSLAQKGAAPAILGFAVENGGLERQVDGTTITFRGNPVGLYKAFQGNSYLKILSSIKGTDFAAFANRFSFAVSFDASRGQTTPTFVGSQQQIASWSVRAQLWNDRDPLRGSYAQQWRAVAEEAANPLVAATMTVRTALRQSAELTKWLADLQAAIASEIDPKFAPCSALPAAQRDACRTDAKAALTAMVTERFSSLPLSSLATTTSVISALPGFQVSLKSLADAQNEVYSYVQKGTVSTIDWTVVRDPNLPDLNTITWVYSHSTPRWGGAKSARLEFERHNDLTLNGSATWYRTKVGLAEGQHQFRDFKVTGQYDVPLGKFQNLGPLVLTFAGRYEWLPNDTVTPRVTAVANATGANAAVDSTSIALAGHLGVFQTKLTIPAGSGMKIPLSFTVANRSELIKEKKAIGAQIGITFDMDSIFARASGGK